MAGPATMRAWAVPGRDADQTQRLVEQLARMYGAHPGMRDVVARLLDFCRVAPRDELGSVRAVWWYVTTFVRFLNEAGEQVQTPARTLANRYGDCDDRTGLVCAMLEAMRIRWRTVLLARGGVPFHIWPQAWVAGRWVELETSDDRARFDEHPAALMRRIQGLSL